MDEMRLPQHIVSQIERRWAARLGQMTFHAISNAFRPSWSSARPSQHFASHDSLACTKG
jgi:hypothetical protein